MPFSEYSTFYDLYYADKDYAAEVDFVLKLAFRFGVEPQNLLDMGCGTGRHLEEFVKRGLKCDGFDLSAEMLSRARKRLPRTGVGLSEGNITDFESGKQYDLVVAMFAVMGYLVDNEHLLAGLRTAQKHLRPEGVFIFDGWFGPAVLAQQMVRIRSLERLPRPSILSARSSPFTMTSLSIRTGRLSSKSKKSMSCVLCLFRKWRLLWRPLV